MILATLLAAFPVQDIHCSQVEVQIPAPFTMSPNNLRQLIDLEGRWAMIEGNGDPVPLLTFEQPSPGGAWEFRGTLETDQVNSPFKRRWEMELEDDGSLTLIVGEPKWANASGVERGRVLYYRWNDGASNWDLEQVLIHPITGFLRFGDKLVREGDWATITAGGLGKPSFFYSRDPSTDQWSLHGEVPLVGEALAIKGERMLFWSNTMRTLFELDGSGAWQPTATFPAAVQEAQILEDEILARVNQTIVVNGQNFSTGIVRVYRQAQSGGPWAIVQTLNSGQFAPGQVDPLDFFEFEASEQLLVGGGLSHDPVGGPENAGRAFAYLRDPATGNWIPDRVLDRGDDAQEHDFFGRHLAVSGTNAFLATDSFPLEERLFWSLDLDPTDRNSDGVVDVCQSVGEVYCAPANVNSTSLPARIHGLGSAVLSDASLEVCADQLPANEFGYLLGSSAPGFVPGVAGSAGNLCLAGGPDFGRFTDQVGSSGVNGVSCVTLDLPVVPTAVGPRTLLAGETWFFQYWFRDGTTSNHTPGLEVTFD